MRAILALLVLTALLPSCKKLDGKLKVPFETYSIEYGSSVCLRGEEYRSLKGIRGLYTEDEWSANSDVRLIATGIRRFKLSDLGTHLREITVSSLTGDDYYYKRTWREEPVSVDARGMVNLETLELEDSVISSLRLDSSLTKLSNLDMNNARVLELPAIPASVPLEELDLANDVVMSFNRKAPSPGIGRLRCVWGGESLEGIESLPSLKWLVLEGNKDMFTPSGRDPFFVNENLKDVSALSRLSKLEYVCIGDAPQLSDVSTILCSRTITNLRLERLRSLSIPSLAGMTALKAISLEGCSLTSTAFLKGLDHSLSICLLEGNPLTVITGLAQALVPPEQVCVLNGLRPVDPTFTISLEAVERIDAEDLAFLRAVRYPTVKILDEKLARGTLTVVKR